MPSIGWNAADFQLRSSLGRNPLEMATLPCFFCPCSRLSSAIFSSDGRQNRSNASMARQEKQRGPAILGAPVASSSLPSLSNPVQSMPTGSLILPSATTVPTAGQVDGVIAYSHVYPVGMGLIGQSAQAVLSRRLSPLAESGGISFSGTDWRLHALSKRPAYEQGIAGSGTSLRQGTILVKSALQRIEIYGFKAGASNSMITETTENATALPNGATEEDAGYMRMAVKLAKKGIGHTSPNPMVGCVIVKDGQIVGQGFHPKAGEPHAEVFALREAGDKAVGATAYVSLEPCNHTGRTPPCSQALVRAQVKRVVVGTLDPNPLVGGKGVQTLQKAGIQVVVGVEEALCQETAEAFFHRIIAKKPFVTLRYMMSLDGALLGSCEETMEPGSSYSLLLQEHDAVLITDAGLYDDPCLLSCEPGAKQPLRVVLARSLDLPLDSQVFDTTLAPTVVLTDGNSLLKDAEMSNRHNGTSVESTLRSKGVDVVPMNDLKLDFVLDLLYQQGFNSVLLDSRGPECYGLENRLEHLAIAEQAVQKLVVAVSPVVGGDKTGGHKFSVSDELLKLQRVSARVDRGNVIIEGYFPNNQHKL